MNQSRVIVFAILAIATCHTAVVGQVAAVPIRAIAVNAANDPQLEREQNAKRWIRGLIQNELNTIQAACGLSPEQTQKLVNTAEEQWRTKLLTAIRAYVESHNRNNVDFEQRVEKLVNTWLEPILTTEQRTKWNEEVASRLEFRRRIVVGKMVMESEKRHGLSSQQMKDLEPILLERWRDSWWAMYRSGSLPETKYSWVSAILSEAQQTNGNDRAANRSEHYMSGGSHELPSRLLSERFELNGITSEESIPLDKPKGQEKGPDDAAANPEKAPAIIEEALNDVDDPNPVEPE
ncbi:MAG: hypothetical protein ACK52S_16385 [Pirellula sp.]|jgi:hypothetical protein